MISASSKTKSKIKMKLWHMCDIVSPSISSLDAFNIILLDNFDTTIEIGSSKNTIVLKDIDELT
jgi:hypothetical protein